jgi:hypothetical protein
VPANVVISDNTIDGSDVPSAVTVETLKLYGVSGFKPVTVAELPVIKLPGCAHVVQLTPPSSEYSITASVTVTGPIVQERSTVVEVILVADRSVGAGGGTPESANVVTLSVGNDGSDIPRAVTVDTRKIYVVSGVKPITVADPSVIKILV